MGKLFNKYMPAFAQQFQITNCAPQLLQETTELGASIKLFFYWPRMLLVKTELFGEPHGQGCLPTISEARINHMRAGRADRLGADWQPQVYLHHLKISSSQPHKCFL